MLGMSMAVRCQDSLEDKWMAETLCLLPEFSAAGLGIGMFTFCVSFNGLPEASFKMLWLGKHTPLEAGKQNYFYLGV